MFILILFIIGKIRNKSIFLVEWCKLGFNEIVLIVGCKWKDGCLYYYVG